MLDAPFLLLLFETLYVVAVGSWLGSMAFFSFGVAPTVFRALEPGPAGRLVRAVFPIYYAFGIGCLVVALPSLVGRALSFEDLRGPGVGVQAVAIVVGLLVLFYCRNTLAPAINAARDAGPDRQAAFERLHKRSVVLNAVLMVAALGLLVSFAVRPAPKGTGIDEYTPEERARYDHAYHQQMVRAKSRPAPP